MNRVPVALAMLLVLAALPAPGAFSAGTGSTTTAPAYASHYGPADPTYFPDELPMFRMAGEPSIGVNWATGKVFFQHGFETYRVHFDDETLAATWEDVTPPVSEFNVDPMLFTDAVTGRTFAGGLDGFCSVMAFTDDDGETWTPTGNACVATLDHQSIASGPWRSNMRPVQALHDRAVYYCAQASAVTCMTSYDGGLTFATTSQVSCGYLNPGLHGSLHIGPYGHVFLPFKNCGGRAGVAVSMNNGLTWLSRPVPNTVTPEDGFDPDVATSTSGWLYIGFADGTGAASVSLSKNNGSHWTPPVDVGASLGVVTSTFHEMVAGDDERAAVAFLGTTTPGNAFADGFEGVWHLYIATTYDAGETWTTVQATTDPVQRGWICASGTACTSGRNLLDFMDAQIDAQGRVLVGYVDGCIDACAGPYGTSWHSDSAAAVITRQITGKTLFAAYDGVFEELRSLPGGPYAGTAGLATPLDGLAAGGLPPYAYAWGVDAAPAGSAADRTSFSDPTVEDPTFTPDVAGEYTLRLTVSDAAGASATATTTFTAAEATGPSAPLTDADNDHGLDGTDIREALITGETAETFDVVLKVDDLAQATPSTANTRGISWGAETAYSVEWDYQESEDNVVRYAVSASQYAATLPGEPATRFDLAVIGAGATSFHTNIVSLEGVWDAAAGTITWTVPKDAMSVKKAPTSPKDDEANLTAGRTPVAGDTFTDFGAEVRTWYRARAGFSLWSWDSAAGSGSHTLAK